MEILSLVFAPFVLFIVLPPAALVPAVALMTCSRRLRAGIPRSGRLLVAAAIGGWLAYAAWESAVWVWSRDVIAPIRVDLLLIAPGLYGLTFVAVRTCWRAGRAQGGDPTGLPGHVADE